MADLTGLTTNYFATPKEGFTTTLASTISSGATTVPLNSITGYTNGAIATMVVEPTSVTAKQVFTGVVDTAGIQLTSVKWTEGTNQSHAAGSTVVDYVTATHMAALVKGLTTSALDQDGTLKAGAVDNSAALANAIVTVPKLTTELQKGWEDSYGTTTFPTPNTITYNGNGSYDCVYNSVDLTSAVSVGMRQKFTRTVTAPTQCTSLNGTTQYYSRSSANLGSTMTFTDTFTCSAWIKPSSYATSGIITRYNGTSGWLFRMESTGQIGIFGFNAGAANTRNAISYQSVSLNKWTHVAATFSMSDHTSTTCKIFINGVEVPSSIATGGTNPTSLIQAGNLEIGAYNGGTQPYTGKIAQAAVFSSVLSASTIRSYASQTYSGSESTEVSAYSFNNSINDLNANANNLTANGGALATNADSPFGQQADGTTAGTTEYAIITKTAFSTNTTITVQVPEGCALPTSGGISAVSYSTQKAPYGFPGVSAVIAEALHMTSQGGITTTTDINGLSVTAYIPAGSKIRLTAQLNTRNTTATTFVATLIREGSTTLTTANTISESNTVTVSSTPSIELYPTEGNHTYKVTANTSGGTSTVDNSPTAPGRLILELIPSV